MSQSLSSGLGVASATASLRVDAIGHRRALALLLQQSAPGTAIAGCLGANPVSGYTAQLKYKIAKSGFVLTRTPDVGAVILPNPATFDIATTAAPSTNPRIDSIIVRQPLEDQGETGNAYIDVLQGTPAASPVAPTLPSGALLLANHKVNPGDVGTATNEGFTDVAADVSMQAVIAALQSRTNVLVSSTDPAASGTVPNGTVWLQPSS